MLQAAELRTLVKRRALVMKSAVQKEEAEKVGVLNRFCSFVFV